MLDRVCESQDECRESFKKKIVVMARNRAEIKDLRTELGQLEAELEAELKEAKDLESEWEEHELSLRRKYRDDLKKAEDRDEESAEWALRKQHKRSEVKYSESRASNRSN